MRLLNADDVHSTCFDLLSDVFTEATSRPEPSVGAGIFPPFPANIQCAEGTNI